MKTNIIIATIFLLLGFWENSFCQQLEETDECLIEVANNTRATYKSWEGWNTSPTGSYGCLNLFINIIYDQTPYADPYPYNNGLWNQAVTEGINLNLPTFLLDFMDVGLNPAVNGTFTRKYHESSFGHLIVTGDFVVINIKQSTLTPTNPGGNFTSNELIAKSIELINNSGGLVAVYGSNNSEYFDRNNDGKFDLMQIITRNNVVTSSYNYGGPYYNWAGNYNGTIVFQNGSVLTTSILTATRSNANQIAQNPNHLIIHEFAHHLLGSNEFHTSGGHSWGGVSGQI